MEKGARNGLSEICKMACVDFSNDAGFQVVGQVEMEEVEWAKHEMGV